ncbi:DUF397 domain-containing protein [Kitasatospora sp. NPDC101183]|uniref:DUF397 domain-containing protein n=1 Tax=Kitasatospora sp. NPDC101183 TaxID=3364100 RepID=UPI0037FE33E5
MSGLHWQKSSFSGSNAGGNCMELAVDTEGVRHLRESDEPGIVITTATHQLRDLILSAKAGELDSHA